ncbi:type II toxin-antitoxin system VapC family toxin [Lacunimicrobium album]
MIDTNVMLRVVTDNDQSVVAKSAVDDLSKNGFTLVVVPQCIYEFYVVATRPLANNGLGLTPGVMPSFMESILTLAELLPDTSEIYKNWLELVFAHTISGKPSHDARLVAAMKTHGITHLMTFNVTDFTRFGTRLQSLILHQRSHRL